VPKNEELQKHTLNLRKGDFELIGDFFPDLGASRIIRTVVSRYVDELEGDSTQANVEVKI